MATDLRIEPRVASAPADHAVDIDAVHRIFGELVGAAPGRAEEGLLRIPEPRRLNIGVKVGFQVMMALGARSCGLSRVAKDRRGRGIASAKPYATGERFATGGSSEIRLTPRLPQRGIIRFRMPDRDMLQPRVQARRRPR